MKFLVTGASGQLGREWVHFLNENKLHFEAFSSGELDVTDQEMVHQKIKKTQPDVVINCAAYTNVDGAESESQQAFLVNEAGVENLVEACRSAGAKLVHYSTDFVFSGSDADRNKYPEGYPEEASTNPVNTYGKSKEAGEKVLQKSGCQWLLVRISWLCGRYGSNFVKTMLRLSSERDTLNVVDDLIGCPSFSFDVVEKTHQFLKSGMEGIYHVSCDGKISWADFAREIFHQTGLNVQVTPVSSEEYPFVAERPRFTLLSNQKAKKAGLRILPWKKGLGRLLELVKENQS